MNDFIKKQMMEIGSIADLQKGNGNLIATNNKMRGVSRGTPFLVPYIQKYTEVNIGKLYI